MKKRIMAFGLILTMLMSMCSFTGVFAADGEAAAPTPVFTMDLSDYTDETPTIKNGVTGSNEGIYYHSRTTKHPDAKTYKTESGEMIKALPFRKINEDGTNEMWGNVVVNSETLNALLGSNQDKELTVAFWAKSSCISANVTPVAMGNWKEDLKSFGTWGSGKIIQFSVGRSSNNTVVDHRKLAENVWTFHAISMKWTDSEAGDGTGTWTCVGQIGDTAYSATVNATHRDDTTNMALYIGGYINANNIPIQSYTGDITGFSLYNQALTAEELNAVKTAQAAYGSMEYIPSELTVSAGTEEGAEAWSHAAAFEFTFNAPLASKEGFTVTNSAGDAVTPAGVSLSADALTATVDLTGLPADAYTITATTAVTGTYGATLPADESFTYTLKELDIWSDFTNAGLSTDSAAPSTFADLTAFDGRFVTQTASNYEDGVLYITEDGALCFRHDQKDGTGAYACGFSINEEVPVAVGKVVYDFDILSPKELQTSTQKLGLYIKGTKKNTGKLIYFTRGGVQTANGPTWIAPDGTKNTWRHITVELIAANADSDWTMNIYADGTKLVDAEDMPTTLARATYGDIQGLFFADWLGSKDKYTDNYYFKNISVKYFGNDTQAQVYRMHFRTAEGVKVTGIGDNTTLVYDYLATGDALDGYKVYLACYDKSGDAAKLLKVCEPAAISRDGNIEFTIAEGTTHVVAFTWDGTLVPLCEEIALEKEPDL